MRIVCQVGMQKCVHVSQEILVVHFFIQIQNVFLVGWNVIDDKRHVLFKTLKHGIVVHLSMCQRISQVIQVAAFLAQPSRHPSMERFHASLLCVPRVS